MARLNYWISHDPLAHHSDMGRAEGFLHGCSKIHNPFGVTRHLSWIPFIPVEKNFPDYPPTSASSFSRSKAHPQIPQMTQIPKCRRPRRSHHPPPAPPGPTGFQGGGSLAPLVRKRRPPENPYDKVARPRPSRGGPCYLPGESLSSPLFAVFNLCNRWNLWIQSPFLASLPNHSRLRFGDNQETFLTRMKGMKGMKGVQRMALRAATESSQSLLHNVSLVAIAHRSKPWKRGPLFSLEIQ